MRNTSLLDLSSIERTALETEEEEEKKKIWRSEEEEEEDDEEDLKKPNTHKPTCIFSSTSNCHHLELEA